MHIQYNSRSAALTCLPELVIIGIVLYVVFIRFIYIFDFDLTNTFLCCHLYSINNLQVCFYHNFNQIKKVNLHKKKLPPPKQNLKQSHWRVTYSRKNENQQWAVNIYQTVFKDEMVLLIRSQGRLPVCPPSLHRWKRRARRLITTLNGMASGRILLLLPAHADIAVHA